jgi:hypothetical protein
LELIVRVAIFDPVAVGLNVKVWEQVALIAIVVQFPVLVKAAAFVPDNAMLLTVMDADPMFLMVRVWDTLVVLMNWLPNDKAEGVTEMMGAAEPPVPDSPTTIGDPGAFEAMLKFAAFAPVVVGLKVTDTVHAALGATVVQPFVGVKDDASVPVTDTPVTDRLAVPVLVIVTVDAALGVLIGWLANVTLIGDAEIPGDNVKLF